jgi:hypothetical protein
MREPGISHRNPWISRSETRSLERQTRIIATMTTEDPLVSTDWLAAHLDDPKVKIVDASFKMPGITPLPKDDYLAAHIPGAVIT